jgi:hypothetical protein
MLQLMKGVLGRVILPHEIPVSFVLYAPFFILSHFFFISVNNLIKKNEI